MLPESHVRLGVNIDHVATLRNARNENFPNLSDVAILLTKCEVDLITVHLREDRRHILDKDVFDLKSNNFLPVNLEMASTTEMKEICIKVSPEFCCIVPEKREELTTEGGLDVRKKVEYLKDYIEKIKDRNKRIKKKVFKLVKALFILNGFGYEVDRICFKFFDQGHCFSNVVIKRFLVCSQKYLNFWIIF